MTGIAQTAFETIGIRGYASLDVRLDSFGTITVLEVNANPGVSSTVLSGLSVVSIEPSGTSSMRPCERSL